MFVNVKVNVNGGWRWKETVKPGLSPTKLQLAAVGEGVAEGDGVDEFEAGAGGDAGR